MSTPRFSRTLAESGPAASTVGTEPRPKILIVDDDADVHEVLREILAADHAVLQARDQAGALRLAQDAEPDVVLLDLNLGHGLEEGFALLGELRRLDRDLPVIILSSYQDPNTVVRAMKAGARHFLGKSPRYDEVHARVAIALAERRRAFALELQRPQRIDFLAGSPALAEILRRAERAAASDLSVLILGETGTGKSILARWIHEQSPQRGAPFRAVNVAAVQPTLLDSELFGHERGAFTGADRRRRGLFELAAGGTLFLDEIGDLSRECQVKLLQAAEYGSLRRVGGEQDLTVAVRILSATHHDLRRAIVRDSFRSDLYYRLAGVEIRLPALRETPERIEPLARRLAGGATLTAAALALLRRQPWPGNVRELQQTLKRALLEAEGDMIGATELERAFLRIPTSEDETASELWGLPYDQAAKAALDRFRRRYVEQLLARHRGIISQAARESGLSRTHLYSLIKQFGLADESSEPDASPPPP